MNTENYKILQDMLQKISTSDMEDVMTYSLISHFKRKVLEVFPFDQKKYYQVKNINNKTYCEMCDKHVVNINNHRLTNGHKLKESIFLLKEQNKKDEALEEAPVEEPDTDKTVKTLLKKSVTLKGTKKITT